MSASSSASAELSLPVRLAWSFLRICGRRLGDHDLLSMSAALSFRTIFALVPVLVLGLLVAKSLGALEDSKRSLRAFLDASGFAQIKAVEGDLNVATRPADNAETRPASQPAGEPRVINVADEIERVVARVEAQLTFQRIGPIGGLLLIWTAIGLLSNLEDALNRVFGAPRSRSLPRRLLLYWSVMTLSPIVVAAAAFLGQRAIDVSQHLIGVGWLLASIGWAGPLLVGMVVLAAVYKLMPNTHVRFRAAIIGAAVVSVLWLVARWGFAIYVQNFVVKGNLYGLLGVLPLFLLWLYYSWLIFLFGAELAHTAVHLGEIEAAEDASRRKVGPLDLLAAMLAVARRFTDAGGAMTVDEVARTLKAPPHVAAGLLEQLAAAGLLCRAEGADAPAYVPAGPVDRLDVVRVLEAGQFGAVSTSACDPAVAASVAAVRERIHAALGHMTLETATAARSQKVSADAKSA